MGTFTNTFGLNAQGAMLKQIIFTFKDDFLTNSAAPLTSPRTAEPGPGTLTITDTGNKLSIVNHILTASGAQSALADPKIEGANKIIKAGTILYGKLKGNTYRFGYKDISSPANPHAAIFINNNNIYVYEPSAYIAIANTSTVATTIYEVAIIQNAHGGCIAAIKGGIYTNWTLLLVGNAPSLSEKYSSHIYYDIGSSTEIQKIYERSIGGIWGKINTFAHISNYAAIASGYENTVSSESFFLEWYWNSVTSEVLNVMVRRLDDNNCWIIRCTQGGGTGVMTLYEKVTGVETQRATKTGIDISAGTSFPFYIRCDGNKIFFGQRTSNAGYASATSNNTQKSIKFIISSTGIVDKINAYTLTLPIAFDPLTMPKGIEPKNIFQLGDSKTDLATFGALLANNIEINNSFGCYINPVKFGAGGMGVDYFVANAATILSTRNNIPDYILFNLGVNDIDYADKTAWENNYLSIVDTLHAKWPNAKIYCMLVWFRNYLAKCNIIDTHILSAITKRTFLYQGPDERVWLQGSDDGATMTVDGVHYSVAGNLEAANQWKTALGL